MGSPYYPYSLTALFLKPTPLVYSGADVAEELLQQMLDENLRRSEFHRCAVASLVLEMKLS